MSGFFGLLRTDGVAVEPRFLDESAQCLHFRGPDGGQTWAKDGLGTCFSYLETGTRHQSRSQPVMSHVCMRAVSRSAATQYVSAAMPVMENRPRPRRWPCAGFPCWPKISWRSRKVAANFARSPVIRVCLWPESVRMQLTPVWEKRYLELDGQRAKYSQTKLPLGILYVFAPRSSEQDVPRIEKLSPREALLELVQNTYMNWVLNREQRANEFASLYRLVQRVPVRRIVPHAKPEKIAGLCELILQDSSAILPSPTSL